LLGSKQQLFSQFAEQCSALQSSARRILRDLKASKRKAVPLLGGGDAAASPCVAAATHPPFEIKALANENRAGQKVALELLFNREAMKHTTTIAVIIVSIFFGCFPWARTSAETINRPGLTPNVPGKLSSGIIGQVVSATGSASLETPVQCLISIATTNGTPVEDIPTNREGRFLVTLNPGTYVLIPYYPPGTNGTQLVGPSVTVTVTKNHFTAVEMGFTFGPE
jgi:hypothetical protein